jgi:hypothetical protein
MLQDPRQVDEGNMNNVRRETNWRFRKKKSEYLKDKIIELESNSKNKKLETCIGA